LAINSSFAPIFADSLRCGCPYSQSELQFCVSKESSFAYNGSSTLHSRAPSWIRESLTATHLSCLDFDFVTFEQKYTIKGGPVFRDSSGQEITPDIFPFIGGGSIERISDVSIQLSGNNDVDCPIPSDFNQTDIIIQIKMPNNCPIDFINRIKQSDCLGKFNFRRIGLFIGHSDIGYPSCSTATGSNFGAHPEPEYPSNSCVYVANYDAINHNPLVHPIHLGLTTAHWIKEQIQTLCKIVDNVWQAPPFPSKWVLVAFNANTNHAERNKALQSVQRLQQEEPKQGEWITFSLGSSFEGTINLMLEHKFVLSPAGRGLDTHRTLEALMMGRIPIVRWSPNICSLANLPVLRILEWDDLTWDLLLSTWDRQLALGFGSFNTRKMFMPYWADELKNCMKKHV